MRKLQHTDAIEFIFAGKSEFKVVNTKTENEFTFSVKKSKNEAHNFFFVKALVGSELTYIGCVSERGYTHGRKSNVKSDAQCVKVFEYVINKLKTSSLPEFVEVYHNGRCGRCGRTLTVNDSIDKGLGPECIKKVSKQDRREAILNLLLC